ncbi:hypothetical protein BOTNAR_0113g00020 [Botryotinia narcissicola]|uniref:Uncharacterized protein n=1 Tax=Botryotinia narcissicola TaxID=278944 RepID=A0A4Z1ILA7_9HELO|nr:hypothetical protein BOTNAR_0113g00020 [Botryotinia narcissicola]
MATSTPATMATPKWSTWANTAGSTKFLELHDLVVNRSLSPVFGPMTSSDLNYIIKTIHKSILRKNPNIAQDVYNYLLERNVWRYCFVKNKDFNVEHPRYPFQGYAPTQELRDELLAAREAAAQAAEATIARAEATIARAAAAAAAATATVPTNVALLLLLLLLLPMMPRGKHPVSNPNVMTAEDRAKMTACENMAAATQAIKE